MENEGFTVNDRRIRYEAESSPEGTKSGPQGPNDTKAQESPTMDDSPTEGPGFSSSGESSGIDFSAFVFSLARSALIHLGLEKHPEGTQQEPNLDVARETIDILGMLAEKTRGNLSKEEGELIEKLLYTLRVSFVEISKTTTDG